MVGIVVVSHNVKIAEGIKEMAEMMAHNVQIAVAGGLEDGIMGTSYEKISEAVELVCGRDGAVVIMDMGSAIMTTELVLENLKDDAVRMADCPLLEGTMRAAVVAANGGSLEEVVVAAEETCGQKKLA
ncbi:dihydroxyacetone kinase, phosphotransfer subunit [Selenomonas ruminantium]|uniref:phosphoenolpyruvate--glycerone phosphotransferase n=1 Tax=Selenomonas ruminantium TaxID=971 RepID=A0A1M6SDL9_SELRU|nr:dihydroxyacetone kinase phosphoryl donor subunit DhaM [Selenomonas ruminantium]SHK42843.1 dihydroxyacetone kinase, phosphotransfer subunit [Selenomonas ruminantium]